MRKDRGRWFWIALLGNAPIGAVFAFAISSLLTETFHPVVGLDNASSFSAGEVLVVALALAAAYLFSISRYVLGKGWLELLGCDVLLGSMVVVIGFSVNGAGSNTWGAAIGAAGVSGWVAAAAIALDRQARERALPNGRSAAVLGDPTPHQFGVFGGVLLGIPLAVWLWSAESDATYSVRIGSNGIPPAWLTLGVVGTISVLYLISFVRYVRRRGRLGLAVIAAGALAVLLVHEAKPWAEEDLIGFVSLGILCAGVGVAVVSVTLQRRASRRSREAGAAAPSHS